MSSRAKPSAVRRSISRLAVATRSSTPWGTPDSDKHRAITRGRCSLSTGSNAQRAGSSLIELTIGRCLQSGRALVMASGSALSRLKFLELVPVGRHALLNEEEKSLSARRPVALRVLRNQLLRDRNRTGSGLLRLLRLLFGFEDFDQRRLAGGCMVESFRSGGRLRMFLHVLLVELGFLLRALRGALPVSAELVVN